MTTVQKILLVAALSCVSATGFAQRSSELSADFPDSHTMAVQDKVERIFDAGEFERAFFIYRNELAPLGDKYAQYMVGFMYYTGLGVEEDLVAAAAWYQLAAERDTREFVVVRDRLMHVMDQSDADRSRNLFRELHLRYCDLAVLLSSIKRNMQALQSRTGSRLGGRSSSVTIIEGRVNSFRSGSDFDRHIEAELEAQVRLLKEISGFVDLSADPGQINMHDLERRVLRYIEAEAD
jgi:Sel1 repeat-containing protein